MNMLFALVIALCMFSTRAEGKKLTGSEMSECVNKLLEWCKGMTYSKGNTQYLSNYHQDNDSQFQFTCASDWKGTNCTRDKKPWFTCSPDHVVTFKGKKMSKGMTKVDNSICEARKAVNEKFLTDDEDTDMDGGDMDWDDLTLTQKAMGSLSEDMRSLYEDMARLKEDIADMDWDDFEEDS